MPDVLRMGFGVIGPGVNAKQRPKTRKQAQVPAQFQLACQQDIGQVDPPGEHPAKDVCLAQMDDEAGLINLSFI